jgi:cell division protein FtsA
MRGTKLEIKALKLTYSMQHLEDLGNALALAGIEATEIVGAPIAEASVALTEKQKIVGVGLVNIGSETVTLTVFENGAPILIQTFQIGSSNVTNDVALGLKIPLDLAENLKRGGNNENYSKKKLDEIVDARMADIFESIDNSLKKIKRSELLPAGIVFTGGGANMSRLPELSKSVLNLPSFIGSTEIFGNIKTKLRDPSWFAVLGLLTADKSGTISDDSSIGNLFRDIKNGLKSISKQLLP